MTRVLEKPNLATIGDRIRHARKDININQADLAKRVGVSQPTVANWESGVHDPRRLMLAKISDILSVPMSWLAEGARSSFEHDKQPAAAYLRRYLQHVPVISYENAKRFANVGDNDPHEWAEDYIPVTYGAARLFAVFVTDDSVNHVFAPDTLVVIDYSDRKPRDGNFCLAMVDGQSAIRRWRPDPARLEPYSNNPEYETIYSEGPFQIIGSVRVSIRFH